MRRSGLLLTLVLVATMLVTTVGAGPASGQSNDDDCSTLPPERLGVQLYTLRSIMTDQAQAAEVLEALAEIGYSEVETAGMYGWTAEEFRAVLDANGLTAPSMHIGIDQIQNELDQVIADAQTLGATWITLPYLGEEWRTPEGYAQVAEILNSAGARLAEEGLRIAYHNHDFDFDVVDGVRLYDVLAENTDPELVDLELDIYWAVVAGVDPVALFEQYPGRFSLLHLKDVAEDGSFADVGEGTVDWERVLTARDLAGVEHYFVEHDQPEDPLASVADSYAFLSELCVPDEPGEDCFTVPAERIGVQLFTLRSIMTDQEEAAEVLEALAEIGYRQVETAGTYGWTAEEFREVLDASGISVASMHIGYSQVRDNLDQVIADALALGSEYVVVPSLPGELYTPEGFEQVAEVLNEAGAELAEHGLTLGFHNHAREFMVVDGQRLYDVLLDHTDPELVDMQLDVYWAAVAGVDPVELFERYPGRFSTLHVKDMGEDGAFADVGEGILNWERIVRERDVAGVEYYFVEHDRPEDPLASVTDSFEYLSTLCTPDESEEPDDTTAPTVTLDGAVDGALYGDSETLDLSWEVSDDSGEVAVVATLDGERIEPGELELWRLDLGFHEIEVTATDPAVNTTTVTVQFYLTTSFRDMDRLLDQFEEDGLLSQRAERRLHRHLMRARRLELRGRDRAAIRQLERFKDVAADVRVVPNDEVREVLFRDADAMIIRLGGTPRQFDGGPEVSGSYLRSLRGTALLPSQLDATVRARGERFERPEDAST